MGHIRDLRKSASHNYKGSNPFQARVSKGKVSKDKSFATPEAAQAWIDYMEGSVLFSSSYDEYVLRGRLLVKKHYSVNWEIGDLLLELVPLGSRTDQNRQVGEIIRTWMDDIDSPWSFQTILKYRETAHHWPRDKREPETSFTVHKLLANNKDRFEIIRPGLEVRDVYKILGRKYKEATPSLRNSSVYDKTRAMLSFAQSALKSLQEGIDMNIDFPDEIQEHIDATRLVVDEIEEELSENNIEMVA